MKKLVVLLMVALFATGAMAQLDMDANSIGIYFDADATMNTLPGAAGAFDVFLVLVNSNVPAVRGFSLDLHVDSTSGGYWSPFGPGSFPAEAPGNMVGAGENMGVAYAAPRTFVGTTMVLLQTFGEWYNPTDGFGIHWTVLPATAGDNPGAISILADGGAFVNAVDPANGGVCAWVGSGPAVIANEQATFGGVKALYR